MSKNVTVVLAVLNAALLAFIVFVERGTLSTSDLAGRRGQVLERFLRERVERVELVRGDEEPIVLVREHDEDDAEDGLDLGTWRIASPIETNADDDAVDSFLSALEWLAARRTLADITSEDRTRFGLDEPRFSVRFSVAGEEVELRVGGEAPTGEGVYAAVEGSDRAYVVGADFVESIDHDLSHFRDKHLFSGFYGGDARTVQLEREGVSYRFDKREGGGWNVEEPVRGYANAGLVDGVLRLLRELRATRFVAERSAAERAGALAPFGLDAAWCQLTVSRPEDADGQAVARLAVGDVCGEHADERYARAGEGPVVCVPIRELSALEVTLDRVRERRLLALSNDAIESVRIQADGGELELRRATRSDEDAVAPVEGGWELVVGDEPPIAADDQAVAAWLDELRESRAVEFVPIDSAARHGLDSPDAVLTVRRSDSDGELIVRLGDHDDRSAWVRRGDEAVAVRVEGPLAERLSVRPLRFRARQLLEADPGDARSVFVRHRGIDERAVRGEGGSWRLEAPVTTEADRVVVREVVRVIAELRAARFVADEPTREHGLSDPTTTVTVQFDGDDDGDEDATPRTVTLALGADTVDGTYARLDANGPVFELDRTTVESLRRPLVSLDLLTIPTADLASLRVERGEERVELTHDGARWELAGGGAPDPDRTRALLDRLSTLRAGGVVRYGPPALSPVEQRIVATRRTDAGEGPPTVTLELGAVQGEGEDAFVAIRRSDLDVVFRIRPEVVQALLGYHP